MSPVPITKDCSWHNKLQLNGNEVNWLKSFCVSFHQNHNTSDLPQHAAIYLLGRRRRTKETPLHVMLSNSFL